MENPSFDDLKDIFLDESKCIEYLIENRILHQTITCSCGNILRANVARKSFRCFLRDCRKETSLFRGSFFSNIRLSANKALHFAFLWLCGATSTTITAYLGISSKTAANYISFFQNLVADSLENEDFKIGGPGIIVEIDESKFGKRKYNRGHIVEGAWIFGGVERTPERKVFLVHVPDRSAQTLLQSIERHVLPGSIIYSDLWRAYNGIEEQLGLRHFTVNHSINFVDPETGIHTNTIEGTWSGIKRKVPACKRVGSCITLHLLEFVWRRKYSNNIWDGFIKALKEIEYVND